MIIKKINIVGFGKLSDFSLDFTSGSNVVYGKNEDGKTTIMAFIKMMFYGTTSKQSESYKNLRKRYKPLNAATFGGSIEFVSDGVNYRLEREFKGSNSTDKITLYNLDLLKPVALSGADVGSEFFGLSADAFEKSVYIGNIGYEDLSSAGGEINSKLANITQTGDEDVSFDLIKKRLENFKGVYTTPRKVGALDKLNQQINSLKDDLFSALENDNQRQAIAKKIEDLKEQKQLLSEKLNEYNEALKGFKASMRFSDLKSKFDAINKCKEYESEINALEASLSQNGEMPKKEEIDACFSSIAVLKSLREKIENLNTAAPANENSISDIIEQKQAELEKVENELQSSKKYWLSKKNIILFFILVTLCFGSCFGILKSGIFVIPTVIFGLAYIIFMFFLILRKIKLKSKKEELLTKQSELVRTIQDLRLKNLENDRGSLAIADSLKEQESAEFKKLISILSRFVKTNILDVDTALSVADEINKKLLLLSEQKAHLSALKAVIDTDKLDELTLEYNELCKLSLLPANDEDIEFVNKKITVTNSELSSITEQIATLNGSLSSSHSGKKTVSQIEKEITDLQENCETFEKYISASDIALSAMNDAYAALRGSFSNKLNEKVEKILCGLTNGKYKKVGISDTLSVNLDSGILTDARHFSSGTLDQTYFALRLGVAELIGDEVGGLPLLLDDAFLQYDDERMKNGFKFLADYSGQSVMFTCRKEFAEFAKTLENTTVINL